MLKIIKFIFIFVPFNYGTLAPPEFGVSSDSNALIVECTYLYISDRIPECVWCAACVCPSVFAVGTDSGWCIQSTPAAECAAVVRC